MLKFYVCLFFCAVMFLLGSGCSRKFCWECTEVKEYTFMNTDISVSGGPTSTGFRGRQTTISDSENNTYRRTYQKCDESEADIRNYERKESKEGEVAGDDEGRVYPSGTRKKTTVNCRKQ